jgi:hypothetical protein
LGKLLPTFATTEESWLIDNALTFWLASFLATYGQILIQGS